MPYSLPLPNRLAGWKVKIFDNERLEDPHLTILFKHRHWRLGLRDGKFIDRGDAWNQIDEGVRKEIQQKRNWQKLKAEWNRIHPQNPT